MKYPKRVTVIELENAPFRGAKPAFQWATSHGVVGIMSDADSAGKGEISIEISNIEVLKGVAGFVTRPSDRTSNGVCDVNGEPLLK